MVTFLLGPSLARRLSKRQNFKGRNKLNYMKGHCLRSTQVFMGCSPVQSKDPIYAEQNTFTESLTDFGVECLRMQVQLNL